MMEATAELSGNDGLDPERSAFGYRASLDGLRGVAIIVVMAFNGHFLWMKGGFVGVDIFFVLSGFLITSLLVGEYGRSSRLNFGRFYLRRALRLLPALIVLMIFCVAYASILQTPERAAATLKGVLYTLLYVANWAQSPPHEPGIGALSHAWSLSVEEQFYIVWPLILFALLKLKNRTAVLAILAAMIAASVLTSVWLWREQVPFLRLYFGSDTRAHELLIGCVAALLYSWETFPRSTATRTAFAIATVLSLTGLAASIFFARHLGPFVYNGGFTLISVATAIVILDLMLFRSSWSPFFELAPLVWIGRISYGLYLWHFPVFEASRKLFEDRIAPGYFELIGVVATFVVAALSFYLVEKPFLTFRHRLASPAASH